LQSRQPSHTGAKPMKFWTTCVLIIVSAFSATHAQQGPAIAAPDELFNQSKWAEAAAAYSEVVAKQPANGPAWQNLGESLLQQHKDTEAAAAFERAIAIPYRPKSLAELQKVFDSGYGGQLRPLVISSPEFAVWKDDPEFTALVEKMAPCRGPEFRKFDFWIGDWDVHAPDGGPTVGHNLVTLEQDGCLIIEHWTASTGGQTGTSFNYYDVRDKKWHQLYLDNSGNAGAFPAMAGDLVANKMVLLTDDTKSPLSRWTWYVLEPGKVRQMAEQSTDGGKTWTTGWDSVYLKQK
jgi:hypothetical protein